MSFNRTIYILIALLLVLTNCRSSRNLQNDSTVLLNPTVEVPDLEEYPPILDVAEAVEVIDTLIIEVNTDTIPEITSIKKGTYRIGIIMPFMEDSLRQKWDRLTSGDYNDYILPNEAEISMSFLEGAILSLEELDLDANFEFVVYDNERTPSVTQRIIERFNSDNLDVVIGPFYKRNVKLVADYAKENEIIHISPFAPSKSIAIDNPYYYMLEPSIAQHTRAMVDYIVNEWDNASIKIMHEDTKSGRESAFDLVAYINELNSQEENSARKIPYATIEVAKDAKARGYFNIGKHLDFGQKNAVIVMSFDDGFVHSMLTQINTKIQDYDIATFGMPTWMKSNNLRLEYFNSLEVYFSKGKWINEDMPASKDFQAKYKSRYEKNPPIYAYTGYDVVDLFCTIIDENGLTFEKEFLADTFKGTVADYNFKKI